MTNTLFKNNYLTEHELKYKILYQNVLVEALIDPLLDLGQIDVDLDEPQFTSALDELIRLHHQFL